MITHTDVAEPTMTAKPMLIGLILGVLFYPGWLFGACKEESFARGLVPRAHAATADATLSYFGHNFFQIVTRQGTRIVTDPLAPGWYPTPSLSADLVTISRNHLNHNFVGIIAGRPLILWGAEGDGAEWPRIRENVKDVLVYNVPILQKRRNGDVHKGSAFVFDLGVLCIVHLGDLSHKLTSNHLKQIGKADIALTPIGGRTTMGPELAREVILQLKPKIAIPMHYRDDLERVRVFSKGFPVQNPAGHTLTVSKGALPAKTHVFVMPYPGGPF